MTKPNLPHVDRFVDRLGAVRHYFRRGHGRRVALPGAPGSAEFMAAYHAAFAAQPTPAPPKRAPEGTFARLAQDYFAAPEFLRLKQSSRVAFRNAIEKMLREDDLADAPVAAFRRSDIKLLMSGWAATPAAANNNLKRLRALIRIALDQGLIETDPTQGVARFKIGTHHTWTESEIAQFEDHWPAGSKQRTALALLLYTGQRRSDVVRMVWPDIDGGLIRVAQVKTGKTVYVPLHSQLADILAQAKREHVVILTAGQSRRPFSAAGFGNFMADAISAAGLPDRCVTHGLRKASARRLAEAGCTTNELSAILGMSLQEVARYTAEADKERLSRQAMARLESTQPATARPKFKQHKSQPVRKYQ